MKRGLTYSLAAHGAVAALLWFGLPSLSRPLPPEEQTIVIDVVPVSEVTRASQLRPKPDPKPEPEKQVAQASPPPPPPPP
ncbi:MAG TPA: hypothetical protein DCK97_20130, partial [Tistrella mobilis]|nr:hypothetical protein [Tistrella mobilis]